MNIEETRRDLHVYMSRTGLGLREIADRAGYAHLTLRQFSCGNRLDRGDWKGDAMAERLKAFMQANPPERPEFEGKLYETKATREMDRLIAHAKNGGWGTIYGPAGAQKSYLLGYRAGQAAAEQENCIALIEGDVRLSPRALLARIAQAMGAPWAQSAEGLREAILFTARRRMAPTAVIIDEAQLLYRTVDTLEALRRLGDRARGKLGILLAGNEQVMKLFEPRCRNYFEQWRSRVEQRKACVMGPSRDEAIEIAGAELPQSFGRQRDRIVEGSTVPDPYSKKPYVNMRRLFGTIREFRAMHAAN